MLQKPATFHALFTTIFRRKPTNTQKAHQSQSQPSRPHRDDRDGWRDYWQKMGQPWRTEPEIDAKRQRYLTERRAIIPDIKHGIYPFKDVKLSRADVEWLLATHENGRGPVDWEDESQHKREGLDLRGSDLRNVDLRDLPLARVRFGLNPAESFATGGNSHQREMATTHLDEAILWGTHLEGAFARGVHVEKADLHWAHLEEANMRAAHMEGAKLSEVHLEGAHLPDTNLGAADLSGAFFDAATDLEHIILGKKEAQCVSLVDVHWGDANLAVITWSQVNMLGNEQQARQKMQGQSIKSKAVRLKEYEQAVRANRQLAVALQSQGLNEDAARFAYRAHVLQKSVLRLQMLQPKINFTQRLRLFGSWLFSWFLFLLAGYGYRPGRSIIAYLLMICLFATAYFLFGLTGAYHLQWYEALVVSLTAFHGRGFFAEQYKPGDPQTIIAAIEAVVGLVIEISFIATFTQRFFGK